MLFTFIGVAIAVVVMFLATQTAESAPPKRHHNQPRLVPPDVGKERLKHKKPAWTPGIPVRHASVAQLDSTGHSWT